MVSDIKWVRNLMNRLGYTTKRQRWYKEANNKLKRLEERDRQLKIMFQKIQGAKECLLELKREKELE